MAEKLSGNVGWGIGLEFRESNHLLRTRTTAACRPGMAFNVVVGARALAYGRSSDAALYASDLRPHPTHSLFSSSCCTALSSEVFALQHSTVDRSQGYNVSKLFTAVRGMV